MGTYSGTGGQTGTIITRTVGYGAGQIAPGRYDISAYGGGGGASQDIGTAGGKGAEAGGYFTLTQGEVLKIIAASAGSASRGGGGGGGASQIFANTGANGAYIPLLIAGGGGGGGIQGNGMNAAGYGGSGGGGGASYYNIDSGGGGAGANGDGNNTRDFGGFGGSDFVNGGNGGAGDSADAASGGFGGGGGGSAAGGGGGGYTGGQGGDTGKESEGGYGGTSFIAASGIKIATQTKVGAAAPNSGNGSVTLALIPPPTITADTASPSTGDEGIGQQITFTLTTSKPVTVTGTPTLALNDGGTASYVAGSSTSTSLVFTTTVAAGQNANPLAVTGVTLPNGATIRDTAGNDLATGGAAATFTGLQVDGSAPTVSITSPGGTTTTASQTIAGTVSDANPGATVSLFDNGSTTAFAQATLDQSGNFSTTVTLAQGTNRITAQDTDLAGNTGASAAVTYTLAAPSGGGGTSTPPPTSPTITGTHATVDAGERTVAPFGTSAAGGPVTIADTNANAMDSLTITLAGGGGTLTGMGLTGSGSSYMLAATDPGTLTSELDALTFTPTAGAPGVANPTTFTLAVASNAGTSAADSNTVVTDTAASASGGGGGSSGVGGSGTTPIPVPDAVSISPVVSYANGVFTLTGTASSASGMAKVEITADVDGVATDLGVATVDANGNFSFKDVIGAHTQSFITATEIGNAGSTAVTQASYSLTGGLAGRKGEQDRYSPDGSVLTATDVFKANGSQNATLLQPGQTFTSSFFDTFENNGTPLSTFVFNPGFGRDVVDLFRVDGADHDTLSFKGSDYGNDIATVLNASRDTAAGLLITDPTASSPGGGPGTHDTLLLKGITKQQFAANQGDIAFHA